jgi:hypothetical protein
LVGGGFAGRRVEAAADVAVELGLARKTSIGSARKLVDFATALVEDHPSLLRLVQAGRVSTMVARAVVNETERACQMVCVWSCG